MADGNFKDIDEFKQFLSKRPQDTSNKVIEDFKLKLLNDKKFLSQAKYIFDNSKEKIDPEMFDLYSSYFNPDRPELFQNSDSCFILYTDDFFDEKILPEIGPDLGKEANLWSRALNKSFVKFRFKLV